MPMGMSPPLSDQCPEAAALLVLSKKLNALFHTDGDA